jgi:hypothetical protein
LRASHGGGHRSLAVLGVLQVPRVRDVRLDERRLEETWVQVAYHWAALIAARPAARWCFPLAPSALFQEHRAANNRTDDAEIISDACPRSLRANGSSAASRQVHAADRPVRFNTRR